MEQDNSMDKVVIRKGYYPSGALERETPYVNGERHGIEKRYYSSGTLRVEAPYEAGKMYGLARGYYESGALEMEVPYVNDKEHGLAKSYNKDNLNIDCIKLYKGDNEVLILCLESYGTTSTKS